MALAALYLEDESLDKYVKYKYTLLLDRRDLRVLLLMSLPRAGAESFETPSAAAAASSTSTGADVSGGAAERPARERGHERDDEQLARAEALVMLLQQFVDLTGDVQSAIALALTLLDAAALLYDPLYQHRLQSPPAGASTAACPPRLHNIAHTVALWIDEYAFIRNSRLHSECMRHAVLDNLYEI